MNKEGPHKNIIHISKEGWNKRKRDLGFSVPETIPETLQAKIGKFIIDLMAAQALLRVFRDSQTYSSALKELRRGLFRKQSSYLKPFIQEARGVKEEKFALISVINGTFSDCSVKIKNILSLLEEKYRATDMYKGLEKISTVLDKFVSDLGQSTISQNAERIISEFRNNLSEQITLGAE